jgi:IclR family transcriptional regulator, pca regulon regulatory protein
MTIPPRDTMGGLAKGLAVIETFSADHPRQSIAEVAVATGLDRATARRCLLTLAHLGYADYDGKYFTLTPRVLRLGTACLAHAAAEPCAAVAGQTVRGAWRKLLRLHPRRG